MEIHKIKNEDCEIEVYRGSIKSIKILIGSNKYEILGYDAKNRVSSFIMAPWANRINEGKFKCAKGNFDLLEKNPFDFKHAIHGTAMFSEWTLNKASENYISISTNLNKPWPYKGNVTFAISLNDQSIKQELSILNKDSDVMPFSMGWHPWFKRNLKDEGVKIKFDAKYKWETKNEIPTSSKLDSNEIKYFFKGYSPEPGTLDECYRIKEKSLVYLVWPELTLKINSSNECGHLMVYTPSGPNSDLVCVEPQTATINPFQLNEKNVTDTGVLYVNPGESYKIFTEWSWR